MMQTVGPVQGEAGDGTTRSLRRAGLHLQQILMQCHAHAVTPKHSFGRAALLTLCTIEDSAWICAFWVVSSKKSW